MTNLSFTGFSKPSSFLIVLFWIVKHTTKGSYAWKSFLQAKHVVKLGAVWRVGNGQAIKIRGDKQLSKVSGSRFVSPVLVLHLDSKVCNLIDHENHTCKRELIAQEFLPHEVKTIAGVPLSIQDVPDKLVWLHFP